MGNLILRLRKVGVRLGQGPGQGWGKVGQGWCKVRTKSKVRARSGQASCDTIVFYSYHSLGSER